MVAGRLGLGTHGRHLGPPYILRTAASLLAQQGVPVTAAAASLGHDPAIYLRSYARLFPGDLRAVAEAIDVARSRVAGQNRYSQPIELASARRNAGTKQRRGSAIRSDGHLNRTFSVGLPVCEFRR